MKTVWVVQALDAVSQQVLGDPPRDTKAEAAARALLWIADGYVSVSVRKMRMTKDGYMVEAK